MLAGRVAGRDATIAGVGFTSLEAAFGGTLQNATIGVLRATGGWGRFAGHGGFSSQQFVGVRCVPRHVRGIAAAHRRHARGTRADRRNRRHRDCAAANRRAGPASGDARRIFARRPHRRREHDARHCGRSHARVFRATRERAGGDLVAAGTFALAPGGREFADECARARRQRIAMRRSCTASACRSTAARSRQPERSRPARRFRRLPGALSIAQARFDRFTMTGNGDVRLAGTAVALQRILGALGGTYANVDGRILRSHIAGARDTPSMPPCRPRRSCRALHSFGLPNYMTDGTFNARLHVAGRSATPNVSGSVGVPAGESQRAAVHQRRGIARGGRARRQRSATHRCSSGRRRPISRPRRGHTTPRSRCARRVRTSPISTTSSIPAIRSTATAPSSSRRRRVMRRSPRPAKSTCAGFATGTCRSAIPKRIGRARATSLPGRSPSAAARGCSGRRVRSALRLRRSGNRRCCAHDST